MKIIKTLAEMQFLSKKWDNSVGFVPTMGFLHEGHLSLVKASTKANRITVVSIYVNPSQFSPNEDLDAYPRDLDRDLELLEKEHVDYVFFPANDEMYPDGYLTWINVNEITNILCGKSRATHFKGVTTIVAKLLNIVNPDAIYLGEKDFQQLAVIKKMVKDLNMPFKVIGCPLVRELDGLAMSSRNKYLSNTGRFNALSLYKALCYAKEQFDNGIINLEIILKGMSSIIENSSGIIEYIEFIDSETLKPVTFLSKGGRILLAVKMENTRLIDNMEI